jgi:hypothetical protein
MMELELKHLAPYPPTLQLIWQDVHCSFEGLDYTSGKVILERVDVSLKNVKPILRPLSDLTKEIEDFGDYNNEFKDEFIQDIKFKTNSYGSMVKLFKLHYDVFGLIDAGLAIDINTLT